MRKYTNYNKTTTLEALLILNKSPSNTRSNKNSKETEIANPESALVITSGSHIYDAVLFLSVN